MPWKPEEVVSDDNPVNRATWYTVPFDAKGNEHEIKCLKVDRSTQVQETDIKCSLKKYAYLGEDGVIYVSLADEDGDHALWRLFDSIKESRFDYGAIRGDRGKLLFKLEFLP